MTDLLRQEIAATANPIVVKIGTRVLTDAAGKLDEQQVQRLSKQLAGLMQRGRNVVLVSSGAVAAGMSLLGLTDRPTDLAHLQAVAAVGQARLIEAYDRALGPFGYHAAQVLLTAGDLHDRSSYLNVRNTFSALLDLNALPIVNENDTVAVEELAATFGDNDRLAALVTNLLRAPLLVILSTVSGLYDGPPGEPGSRLIDTVKQIDTKTLSYAQCHTDPLSKGGMTSKLEAARMATLAGETVILASGREEDVLTRIIDGQPIGTAFLAEGKSVTPWKRWIGFSAKPKGRLHLDAGAVRAVVQQGCSLLAVGLISVEGTFHKGDIVGIYDPSGCQVARGLTNYGSRDLRKIAGKHSERIADILGHRPYEEVVHRNNLIVTARDVCPPGPPAR